MSWTTVAAFTESWSTVSGSYAGSWATDSTYAESWTTLAATTESWSGDSTGRCPPAWAQLSSVTTTVDEGVDFYWQIWDQYPLRICNDRPVTIVSQFSEGKP